MLRSAHAVWFLRGKMSVSFNLRSAQQLVLVLEKFYPGCRFHLRQPFSHSTPGPRGKAEYVVKSIVFNGWQCSGDRAGRNGYSTGAKMH
jgi:hypothetical protein